MGRCNRNRCIILAKLSNISREGNISRFYHKRGGETKTSPTFTFESFTAIFQQKLFNKTLLGLSFEISSMYIVNFRIALKDTGNIILPS